MPVDPDHPFLPSFPLEFLVRGTPVSLQAQRASARDAWRQRVRDASRSTLPEAHWAVDGPVAVTIFYFPVARMQGDIDNVVKLILDALCQHIYADDAQVERAVVQKFEPGRTFRFVSPSPILASAMQFEGPVVYIRVSVDPHEDLI